MSDWRRVTRRYPCPICGRTGWCAVSVNGELCLCMRTESDWPARGGMGGHLHRLRHELSTPFQANPRPVRTVFDARRRATVGDWIIQTLTLSDAHREHLNGPQRRLDHEQIARRGYRTWPGRQERARLAALAVAEFGPLMEGFPGFYRDITNRPGFAGPDGLLLPVRDAENAVQNFQIRPDDGAIGKRIWLSSAGRRGGAGSGAPPHWAWPRHFDDPFTAYIVEGILSADICSDVLGAPCIGVAGKTNWRVLEPARLSQELIERVVIAFDEDGNTSDEALRLAEFLDNDLNVQFARWNGNRAKGLDDCLNQRLDFKIT